MYNFPSVCCSVFCEIRTWALILVNCSGGSNNWLHEARDKLIVWRKYWNFHHWRWRNTYRSSWGTVRQHLNYEALNKGLVTHYTQHMLTILKMLRSKHSSSKIHAKVPPQHTKLGLFCPRVSLDCICCLTYAELIFSCSMEAIWPGDFSAVLWLGLTSSCLLVLHPALHQSLFKTPMQWDAWDRQTAVSPSFPTPLEPWTSTAMHWSLQWLQHVGHVLFRLQ